MDRTSAPGHVNRRFVKEDLATNRPPTELVPEDFNAWQEELMAVIEAAGLAPNAVSLNQVKQALDLLFLPRKSLFTAIVANTVLTVADSGKIIEYTSPGSITLTLPAPGGNAGVHFRIENRSSAGGIVTLATPSGMIYYYTNSAASIAIATSYGVEVYSDGNNWVIKSSASQPVSLGDGQTWQDMSASRAIGVNYTNTTGKPIQLSITFQSGAVSTQVTMTVGGVIIQRQGSTAENTTMRTLQAIVPPGGTYIMAVTVGSIGALVWTELR